VLLHLMAGSKEDAETVTAFFEDMKMRGLNDLLLVTSDGAPGIIKAIEVCFPRAARQRCLAHRMRNLAAKVPEDVWPEFKARVQAAYQAPSRAIARELAAGVVADYGRDEQRGVACFMDDFEACIAHLPFPVTHRRAIRTTNLLERLFVEERRRLKIIPNAFGERAVLKLMFGALIRAAERWRSVKVTEFERRQLAAARKELDQQYEAASGLKAKPSKDEAQIKLAVLAATRSDRLAWLSDRVWVSDAVRLRSSSPSSAALRQGMSASAFYQSTSGLDGVALHYIREPTPRDRPATPRSNDTPSYETRSGRIRLARFCGSVRRFRWSAGSWF
jgi:hypothetical protein